MEILNTADIHTQRGIVFSVAFAAFMAKLDSSILNISLPEIADYFQSTTSQVSHVVLIYMIVLTGTLMLFGKLADRWGLKRLFVTGYAIFTLGSFLCGISWSLGLLVASRFIQGIGGSMLYISAFTLIPRCLPADRTGWAFGLLSSAGALAIAVGGPVGGLITGLVSWHWIFLINVPMGIIAIAAAHRYIPVDVTPRVEKQALFDLPGAILGCTGLALLVYVISYGHEKGWTSYEILFSFVAACAVIIAFVVREKKTDHPIIDFALLRQRDFAFANSSALLAVMVLAGSSFLIPFYLQDFKGLQPEAAGFVTLAYSLVYMMFGPVAGKFSDRTHPCALTSLGMGVGLAASLFFTLTLDQPGLIWIIILDVLLAAAFAMFIAPNNKMVMGLAPRDKLGMSAGMFQTVNNLGQTLGIVLFETAYSWNVPEVTRQGAPDSAVDPVERVLLAMGFRRAFLLSAAICLASLVFGFFIRRGAAEGPDRAGETPHPGGRSAGTHPGPTGS